MQRRLYCRSKDVAEAILPEKGCSRGFIAGERCSGGNITGERCSGGNITGERCSGGYIAGEPMNVSRYGAIAMCIDAWRIYVPTLL